MTRLIHFTTIVPEHDYGNDLPDGLGDIWLNEADMVARCVVAEQPCKTRQS